MPDAIEEAQVYALPARAVPLEGSRAPQGGPTRDELLALAAERAVDPDFLQDNPPFFFRAEISNGGMDAYYTVMQDSTLRNFARDAANGVSFLSSHDVRQLPFGASIAGRFHNGRGDKLARVDADFYTVPNLRTNSVASDDLIRGVKAGILRDVSVGFAGGQTLCSICDRDMDGGFLAWLFGDAEDDEVCLHWPGETYETKDDKGKPTGEKQLCYGRIENAILREVSSVYKGATPNAAVTRAHAAAEAGKLPPELARRLETRFRIALPQSHRAWAGAQFPRKEKDMPEKDQEGQERGAAGTDERVLSGDPGTMVTPAVREALKKLGFPLAADNEEGLRASLEAADAEVTRLRTRVTELEPLADAGTQYRADLLEQVVHQGKRAQGTAFAEETFRGLLKDASIEQLKTVRDSFKAQADAVVQPGARTDATATDGAAPKKGGNGTEQVPASAFKTRR